MSILGLGSTQTNTYNNVNTVNTADRVRSTRNTENTNSTFESTSTASTSNDNVAASNQYGDTLEISNKNYGSTSSTSSTSESDSSSKTSTSYRSSEVDQDQLDALLLESEAKAKEMTDFINKVMGDQYSHTNVGDYTISDKLDSTVDDLQMSVFELKYGLENGTIQVDQATSDKAAELTSEDGYYGVAKTSERILDFAKAYAGNDTDKIAEMKEATQKGFDQAASMWGGMDKAPQITQDTYAAVMQGYDDWEKSANDGSLL